MNVSTASREVLVNDQESDPTDSRRSMEVSAEMVRNVADDPDLALSRTPELDAPPEGLSEVIRALRFRGDEVQFGRVLAAVCRNPVAARDFVRAVLRHVRGGHVGHDVSPVPEDLSC